MLMPRMCHFPFPNAQLSLFPTDGNDLLDVQWDSLFESSALLGQGYSADTDTSATATTTFLLDLFKLNVQGPTSNSDSPASLPSPSQDVLPPAAEPPLSLARQQRTPSVAEYHSNSQTSVSGVPYPSPVTPSNATSAGDADALLHSASGDFANLHQQRVCCSGYVASLWMSSCECVRIRIMASDALAYMKYLCCMHVYVRLAHTVLSACTHA